MDDIELLRRYADEDSQEAFAELVRRHVNLVYSAALRRVGDDTHLAKDVTQKVFIALARQAASVSHCRNLMGWLYTTSRFAAAQVVRTEQRRKQREQKAYTMNESTFESPPALEWDLVRPALDEVMDKLKQGDREALLLRYFSDCPFTEVGLNLGLSEDAARKRVARALERLRALLAKRGVVSATTAAAVAAMLTTHAVSAAPAGFAAAVPGVAVASAATIATPTSGLLPFFTSGKAGAGLAGLLALAAILDLPAVATAVYQLRSARREEAALASANEQYRAELASLREAERAARAAEAGAVPARAALAARPVPALDPRAEGQKFLAEFPEARAMLVETGIAGARQANGSFYRQAGFSGSEIDQFERELAQSGVEHLEVTPAGLRAPAALSDNQLVDLLDQQAFVTFHNYSQIQEAYTWTGLAARELNFAGTPLSSGQTDQLALILASNSTIYRSGQPLDPATLDPGAAAASVDWDSALAQVREVLSPAQWKTAEPVLLGVQLKGAVRQARAPQGAGAAD